MTYQAKAGDTVVVNHNKESLTAVVKAVQANGKLDCTITQRGKYFGSTVVFGQGDVSPASAAAAESKPASGEPLRTAAAAPAEGSGSGVDLGELHDHLDDATSNLRDAFTQALDSMSQEIRAHVSAALSALVDRIEALEAKLAVAPPAAPPATPGPVPTVAADPEN